MGALEDREHFRTYRRQTALKHRILEKYLWAYFNILGDHHSELLYVDAFAGRGMYGEPGTSYAFDGSPIRALKLIDESEKFAACVRPIFVERDKENFDALKQRVAEVMPQMRRVRQPSLHPETFDAYVDRLFSEFVPGRKPLPPTFLFVDPCGITGATFHSLARVVRNPGCEAFVFLNVDGLRRAAGLGEEGDATESLISLFGDAKVAAEVKVGLAAHKDHGVQERKMLDAYRGRLGVAAGAQFVTPYRVEREDRVAASHYFLHVTKHPLGFRIVKDVMWDIAHDGSALELLQASESIGSPLMFEPQAAAVDNELRCAIGNSRRNVGELIEELASRPTDLVAPKYYKRRLVDLEKRREVIVQGKDGSPQHHSTRPSPKGKTTLADHLFVSLRGK